MLIVECGVECTVVEECGWWIIYRKKDPESSRLNTFHNFIE
jgi:hypothetical protein